MLKTLSLSPCQTIMQLQTMYELHFCLKKARPLPSQLSNSNFVYTGQFFLFGFVCLFSTSSTFSSKFRVYPESRFQLLYICYLNVSAFEVIFISTILSFEIHSNVIFWYDSTCAGCLWVTWNNFRMPRPSYINCMIKLCCVCAMLLFQHVSTFCCVWM